MRRGRREQSRIMRARIFSRVRAPRIASFSASEASRERERENERKTFVKSVEILLCHCAVLSLTLLPLALPPHACTLRASPRRSFPPFFLSSFPFALRSLRARRRYSSRPLLSRARHSGWSSIRDQECVALSSHGTTGCAPPPTPPLLYSFLSLSRFNRANISFCRPRDVCAV